MIKKYNIIMILLIISLIIIGFVNFSQRNLEIKEYQYTIDNLKQSFIRNIFNDIQYEISEEFTVIDTNGIENKWSHIIGHNPKLVVFFNSIACELCIDTELNLIKNYYDIIKNYDIIFIISNSNINGVKIIKKKFGIENPIYIPKGKLPEIIKNRSEAMIFRTGE